MNPSQFIGKREASAKGERSQARGKYEHSLQLESCSRYRSVPLGTYKQKKDRICARRSPPLHLHDCVLLRLGYTVYKVVFESAIDIDCAERVKERVMNVYIVFYNNSKRRPPHTNANSFPKFFLILNVYG